MVVILVSNSSTRFMGSMGNMTLRPDSVVHSIILMNKKQDNRSKE